MGAFWEGLSSQSHATGAEPATPPKATANHHHGSPARNSTNAPLIATSIAVPKSGCSITSAVGTAMITPVASTAPTRGGSSCRSRYQAAIIGSLRFTRPDGWKYNSSSSTQLLPYLPVPSPQPTTRPTLQAPHPPAVPPRTPTPPPP